MDRIEKNYFIFKIIFLCIYIVLFVVFLAFVYVNRRKFRANETIEFATKNSEFVSTVFEIFDKSPDDRTCDRLIIVQPFYWFIWACRGELFVLNPEQGLICDAGSTSAVKIVNAQTFTNCCLHANFDSIVQSYTQLHKYKIPYEIKSDKFTIFTALNLLVKNYLSFKVVSEFKGVTSEPNDNNDNVDDDDDYDNDDNDDGYGNILSGRIIGSGIIEIADAAQHLDEGRNGDEAPANHKNRTNIFSISEHETISKEQFLNYFNKSSKPYNLLLTSYFKHI